MKLYHSEVKYTRLYFFFLGFKLQKATNKKHWQFERDES